jgi:beta-galactosidase GanA
MGTATDDRRHQHQRRGSTLVFAVHERDVQQLQFRQKRAGRFAGYVLTPSGLRRRLLPALLLAAAATGAFAAEDIPHLRAKGTTQQLIVDGAPFLIRGGELGNSTASDLQYLQQFWPLFGKLGLNTILAPASWELIEPVEGQFDWRSIDGLLEQARAHDTRVVLLWFGAWKNSMSSYVPAWVKRDQARFPRSQLPNGRGMEILSPFAAGNRDADARAFVALMSHLRTFDARHRTVIMVQVENEIGMIPHARDYSTIANDLIAGEVPAALLRYLADHRGKLARSQGTWEQVFGRGSATEELFMAWHFATYVEAVASAGKRAYPLPMFVNAALVRPGRQPGEYPSAGPLPHLFDVWRAGAPSLDFLAPDIYFPNFVEWARAYASAGNPLFVPETGRAPEATPANGLYAIGELDAIGFSPFAIESYRPDDALGNAYDLLRQLAPLVLEHQGDDSMIGVRPPVSFDGVVDDTPQSFRLGDYTLQVAFKGTAPEAGKVEARGGLIIRLAADEYLVAGQGLVVTFTTEGATAGIESIWEGTYVDGRWVPGRLLNGDESHQGRHLRIPDGKFGIQRVRLYRYQ